MITFLHETPENGWAFLEVELAAGTQYNDTQKMYAAGYLESYLNIQTTWQFYVNWFYDTFTAIGVHSYPPALTKAGNIL